MGQNMPTLLLTGAGGGIGFELARQYAADGWHVIATCRNASAARKLGELPGDVTVESLDVTDRVAVDALTADLADRPIDLLYFNAGINPQAGASLGWERGCPGDDRRRLRPCDPVPLLEGVDPHEVGSRPDRDRLLGFGGHQDGIPEMIGYVITRIGRRR